MSWGFFILMTKEKLKIIKIAYAAKPHGLKGEVELGFLDQNVLENGMKIIATPYNERSSIPKSGMTLTLEKIKQGNKVIASFKEVTDRTQLEAILPFEISVNRQDLDAEEFYAFDLPGMSVISEAGENLGVVAKVLDNGAQEVLEIKLSGGEVIMLPFVENFFPEIDLENETITMVMPEYSE